MKKIDPVWLSIVSELLVDLSAGWFGAAVIIPALSTEVVIVNLGILTVDVVLGILFVYLAYKLRKIKEKKNELC